ncbi:MAG: von Willebrand factor type A domain-containing protein [Verrucomicrobia bacterium]|nr:von Willebrand factor type A domain-containing protein [Verrucomicrobiota bacterium]
MHHDHTTPSAPTPPELEARVVAWVAGELTETEIKELAPLVAASPELTIFKRRIEAVHGLVTEAERPDAEPLRLSPERRAKLLQTIGGAAEAAPTTAKTATPVIPLPAVSRAKRWNYQVWAATAAACVVLGLFLASSVPHFGLARKPNRPEPVATSIAMELPTLVAKDDFASLPAAPGALGVNDASVRPEPLTTLMLPAPVLSGSTADFATPANPSLAFQENLQTAVKESLSAANTLQLPPTEATLSQSRLATAATPRMEEARRLSSVADEVARRRAERTANEQQADKKREADVGAKPAIAVDENATLSRTAPASTFSSTSGAVNTQGDKFYGNSFSSRVSRPDAGAPAMGPTGGNSEPAIPPTDLTTVFPPATPASTITFDSKGNLYKDGVAIHQTGGFYAGTTGEPSGALGGNRPLTFSGTLQNHASAPVVSGTGVQLGQAANETIKLDAFMVASASEGNAKALAPGNAKSGAAGSLTLGSTGPVSTDTVGVSAVGAGVDPTTTTRAATQDVIQLSAFSVASPQKSKAKDTAPAGAAGRAAPTRPTTAPAARGLIAGAVASSPAKSAESQAKAPSTKALFPASADITLPVTNDSTSVVLVGGATSDRDDARRPAPVKPVPLPPVEEASTAKDPVSTFSLHVSDVSFRLAQAALARGEAPDPARIRPEEFYNAFDYGAPATTAAEKIGARLEQAAHPFLQQRNLVRIALKVPATGRGVGTPLHLTVLLDTSGSMEREDRAASVRRALEVLVSLLGPDDRLTLIGFARTPRLLAENLPGDQARSILDLLARTPSEGGTNLEEAIKLGGELARRHRAPHAQNRVVLLTDGAANLGDADPARLGTLVTTLRQAGIAFDACGVGLNGLDDEILEALTRQGDGRYYALNSPADADAGFARQLAGAFRPAAENVKVQVRFNPARVSHYRLIGFEQHRLREQDFRNDQVDAAELAAEEAAVALYQVEVLPQGEGELGEVFVRFRDVASGTMVERSWSLRYDSAALAFDRAAPSLQLAGTAALLAEKLRGGEAAAQIRLRDLAPVVNSLRLHYAQQPRVQELVTMFAQTRRLLND